MSIELKVGQRVKFRNGSFGYVNSKLSQDPKYYYTNYNYDYSIYLESAKRNNNYTKDGHSLANGVESDWDVVEIVEEKNMNIRLKVGQKVKFRNGETGEVVDEEHERSNYDFAVKHYDDGGLYAYVFNGAFDLSSPSQYDVVEIIEDN